MANYDGVQIFHCEKRGKGRELVQPPQRTRTTDILTTPARTERRVSTTKRSE